MILRNIRGKGNVFGGAVAQIIFNEKIGSEAINRSLQKIYPLENTPDKNNDLPPIIINVVKIENCKVLNNLDFSEGDLGGVYGRQDCSY